MSENYSAPAESPEPFDGDRGWNGLARTPGETAFFGIIVVLLVVAVLAGLIWGVTGVGAVFVLLTFVSLAVLIIISMGG